MINGVIWDSELNQLVGVEINFCAKSHMTWYTVDLEHRQIKDSKGEEEVELEDE